MDIVKAYTTDSLEAALERLADCGFARNQQQDYLWQHPLVVDGSFGFQHPLERRKTESFSVLPEEVMRVMSSMGIVATVPAEYFSYQDVVRYHQITHAIPETMIAADRDAIETFVQRSGQGGFNPFYRMLRSLSDVVVLNRQEEHTWYRLP